MLERSFISFIERIIRKKKNPNFRFDQNISLPMLVSLIAGQIFSRFRAKMLFFRGRNFKELQLGKGVTFKNIKKIKLGNGVRLGDAVYLDGLGSGNLIIGDNSSVGAFSRIIISTSYDNLGKHINIGSNVAIAEYSYLGGAGGLDIGNDVIAGQYLSIHPENHNFRDISKPIRFQGVSREGIKVGSNIWIGAKVTILDGVTIGDNCVIAAGAVLTSGNFASGSIIAGVPAKIIGKKE